MELFDPWRLDNVIILGVALQFFDLLVVDVGLDVVAEVGKEEDLSFAVPEKGMVEDVFEHEGTKVIDWLGLKILICWIFAFAFGLVQDEIKKFEVFILTVSLILEQFINALFVELFSFVDEKMEERDHVCAQLESTVVSRP